MRAASEQSTSESLRRASAHRAARRVGDHEATATHGSNRPEAVAQRWLSDLANQGAEARRTAGYARMLNGGPSAAAAAPRTTPLQRKVEEDEKHGAVQRKQREEVRVAQRKLDGVGPPVQREAGAAPRPNHTGLPDTLKAGVESLSGVSLDDVEVHYNSGKPAQLQALAYTQGSEIHVAPGQERHVPHEAWHVAQQKQGRVHPTAQLKGVGLNDDAGLEREADVMGAMAAAVQRVVATAVAVQPDGSQVHTYTHTMPNSRATFLDDFAKGRLAIGIGRHFFTVADSQANHARGPGQARDVSFEWTVDYNTPASVPPAIINVAPAVTRHYLHAHGTMTPNGDTHFANLHVKNAPGGGIIYALQPGDANAVNLRVQI